MFKKLLLAFVTLIATMSFAFAEVEVNKADQAALDGIKGIGPKLSKTILDERKKGGDFKDWADFEQRVKGVGDKSAAKLSENGLTVNGQPLSKTAASAGKEDKKTKAAGKESKKVKAAAGKDENPTADTGKDTKAADTKETKKNGKKEESKK